MCSRKSIGPRIKTLGTPALSGYSCEDFSSRTTQSHLLHRKDKIRPNIWSKIPDLHFWRRPAHQTLSKSLDISSATACVVSDLLKTLAILSNTTVRRSVVDQEVLKSYWKSEDSPHFSSWSVSLLFLSFSKTANHRKKVNRVVVFSCRPFLSIVKCRDHQWDFPTIWKTVCPSDTYWRIQGSLLTFYLKIYKNYSLSD